MAFIMCTTLLDLGAGFQFLQTGPPPSELKLHPVLGSAFSGLAAKARVVQSQVASPEGPGICLGNTDTFRARAHGGSC